MSERTPPVPDQPLALGTRATGEVGSMCNALRRERLPDRHVVVRFDTR